MRIAAFMITGLLLASLAMSMAGSAMAANDSSKVIIVSPSGKMEEGKTATIDVHIFDAGVHVDPTVATATNDSGGSIPLSKKSTGIMSGTVTAAQDFLTANAVIDTKGDAATFMMEAKPAGGCSKVAMDAKEPRMLLNPPAGSDVGFVLHVTKEGAPADDDSLFVTVWNSEDEESTDLDVTKVATGEYETVFPVTAANDAMRYDIQAFVGDGMSCYEYDSESIYITIYDVWFHSISITETSAIFELYASDLDGKAITGATIEGTYSYSQGKTSKEAGGDLKRTTTDYLGRGNITISYSSVNTYVDVDGYVNTSGHSQSFYGSIHVNNETGDDGGGGDDPGTPPPPGQPFDVVFQGDAMMGTMLTPGKTATLPFIAYVEKAVGGQQPFANKDVYYYAYDYTEVVKFGKLKTNAKGEFSLSFPVPEIEGDFELLYIDFNAETSPLLWEEDSEMFFITTFDMGGGGIPDFDDILDPSIQITLEDLKVGGRGNVSVVYPKAVEGSSVICTFLPEKYTWDQVMMSMNEQMNWVRWNEMPTSNMFLENGTYAGTVVIPEFMPEGEYTFAVVFMDPFDMSGGGMSSLGYHMNIVNVKVTKEGAGGGGGGGGGDGGSTGTFSGGAFGIGTFGLLALIIVVVVIIALVGVLVMRRRRADRLEGAMEMGGGIEMAQQPVEGAPLPQAEEPVAVEPEAVEVVEGPPMQQGDGGGQAPPG